MEFDKLKRLLPSVNTWRGEMPSRIDVDAIPQDEEIVLFIPNQSISLDWQEIDPADDYKPNSSS